MVNSVFNNFLVIYNQNKTNPVAGEKPKFTQYLIWENRDHFGLAQTVFE